MSVVYLIQSHDALPQLRRLVGLLQAPAGDRRIVVVQDGSRHPITRADLPAGDDVTLLLRREPVRRGEFSCLEPWLDTASQLIQEDRPFDWLVYLSGRDYPVRPVAEIESSLAATPEHGLLRHWAFDAPDNPWGPRRTHRRYDFSYRRLPEGLRAPLKLARPLLHLAGRELSLTYGVHLGTPARPPLFGPGFSGWGGLQWHSLRRAAVEYVVEFTRSRPEVVQAFRQTLVPDEAYVQTVLLNAGRFTFRNDSRRYTDTQERPGGHCRTLTEADFAELTSGKYDFARKFDPVESAGLLARLERRLQTAPKVG
jgi:Core-2/I-Branching enzyme